MHLEELPGKLTGDLNIPDLERQFDRTKAKVFMGKNASFFGSLLCSMNFYWTADIPSACTDGTSLCWNPHWFIKLPPEARSFVLMHELWHPAAMHQIRRGNRHPEVWNIACDHWINLMLLAEGYSDKDLGFQICKDKRFMGMLEENIYDELMKDVKVIQVNQWGDLVMPPGPPTVQEQVNAVSTVVQAQQVAQIAGEDSPLSDALKEIMKQFLNPIIAWDVLLHRFMLELTKTSRSWQRPNRRYPKMYLPSKHVDRGALTHLAFIEDVSGSITDADALRFNSEVKYVKDKYDPEKLTLVQFDQEITQEKTFTRKDKFDQVEIVGRRGTDLAPVRQWIIDNQPTAAIIFSDLQCAPMEPLPFNIPIIWVAISNKEAVVPFGQLIHIRG